MAKFLGYTSDELEHLSSSSVQDQISGFLCTMFEMPDCGLKTVDILHKAATNAGLRVGAKKHSSGKLHKYL